MSMWEIESLIEEAIQLVGASKENKEHKCSIIWNLYEIQGQFDCSFTNFRVMDILLESGYTKTISLEEHPEFSENKAFFEVLKTKDFEFLHTKLGQAWGADNPTTAYWNKETYLIYYDFGSPLWQELEEGEPQELALYDLGLRIIQEAVEQKNKNKVYDWTAFLINYGLNFFEQKEPIEILKETYFKTIKNIYNQYDFSDYKPMHDSLEVLKEPTEWLQEEGNQFIKWFNS